MLSICRSEYMHIYCGFAWVIKTCFFSFPIVQQGAFERSGKWGSGGKRGKIKREGGKIKKERSRSWGEGGIAAQAHWYAKWLLVHPCTHSGKSILTRLFGWGHGALWLKLPNIFQKLFCHFTYKETDVWFWSKIIFIMGLQFKQRSVYLW